MSERCNQFKQSQASERSFNPPSEERGRSKQKLIERWGRGAGKKNHCTSGGSAMSCEFMNTCPSSILP